MNLSSLKHSAYAAIAWLRRIPVDDPVDQRNASMLQVLLILLGVGIPLLSVLRVWQRWDAGIQLGSELVSLMATALVWLCFHLIRSGRYRLATSLFIGGSLAAMTINHLGFGLRSQLHYQLFDAFPLVLGGLLLGRRALWFILAVSILILAAGALRDIVATMAFPAMRVEIMGNLLRWSLGLLVLALILDRTVTALRDSLTLSARRERDLILARDRLEQEMIEKERSQAQLSHSRKLDVIGRVASGIAHDLNNILAIIAGYASRPAARTRPDVTMEVLDGILDASRRGEAVTRRLLTLSRNDTSRTRVVALGAMLRDTAWMIGQVLGENIRFELDIQDEDRLLARLDSSELELAILNIARNAADAMPRGGVFRITARGDDDEIELVFADTGKGISRDALPHVFEPFFTTKPGSHGTGLGLSMVHRMIVEAGGNAHMESQEGRGTTLTLRLPRIARLSPIV